MKEVFHGCPIDQVGPAYYNIPHPSTQGTNQAGTSHKKVALTGNDDVQAVQSSSEQVQAPLLIKYKIILDQQCSMCNSRWGKFRIKWLILAHQAKYRRRLKK